MSVNLRTDVEQWKLDLFAPKSTDDGRALDLPVWALEYLAQRGHLVVARDLPADTGGGVCCWVEGRPVIYVDERRPPAEQLDILAHELGHAERGRNSDRSPAGRRAEEARCDEWAAAWLAAHGQAYVPYAE